MYIVDWDICIVRMRAQEVRVALAINMNYFNLVVWNIINFLLLWEVYINFAEAINGYIE